MVSQAAQFHTARTAFAAGQGVAIGAELTALSAPMILCTTSGSTGAAPKVIRRSLASWRASAEVNAQLFAYRASDCFACLGAAQHSLALYAAFEASHCGAKLLSGAGLRARAQGALLQQASVLHATPSQIRLLAGQPPMPARLLLLGGGALDPATAALAAELFPQAQVRSYFGASETSFITLADAQTPQGSVGRAYPQVALRLLGADGQPMPQGSAGEIAVQSPYLFERYDQGADPQTRWIDGYLAFGEIGQLDSAGNLTLLGRKNRMFTVAEQNLFPEAMEAWFLAQTGVRQAAVLPRADGLRGAHPVAFVQGGAPEALLSDARAAFGPTLAPRRVVALPDWPLLPAGKTDLQALAAMVKAL